MKGLRVLIVDDEPLMRPPCSMRWKVGWVMAAATGTEGVTVRHASVRCGDHGLTSSGCRRADTPQGLQGAESDYRSDFDHGPWIGGYGGRCH